VPQSSKMLGMAPPESSAQPVLCGGRSMHFEAQLCSTTSGKSATSPLSALWLIDLTVLLPKPKYSAYGKEFGKTQTKRETLDRVEVNCHMLGA